ncbi:hypothetical protein ASE27_12945 [Oerskovia sp. Root918]|uniref:hypothetical protein n=1 Tax=unclassified Oerskovia TaxID=2619021 RepID=UPI00070007CB|nr:MULTISPECIES: hypothetical protein [unclassified Oerskovia]KRC33139.1 hypothetical protein ASE15_15950 [Oerskovia sp. Root22]KRD35691.1 hypothetical protein ASE27_12945 [Oerskovia sp. Root918]
MTRTSRTARAVVGVAALCALGSAGLLPGTGAAVAVEAPSEAAAGEVSPQPLSFSLDGMSPGQTRSTVVDLVSTHASDGVVVDVRVTSTGELGDSISTSIDACTSPWQGDECPSGAVRLVDGWRGPQSGPAAQDVVLPAGATTSLRVLVTLDDDAPGGATGTVTYDLALQGDSTAEGGGTTDPSGPGGPGGPLAATGAAVWSVAALAGAAIGVGAALLRRRRHPEPGATTGQPVGP